MLDDKMDDRDKELEQATAKLRQAHSKLEDAIQKLSAKLIRSASKVAELEQENKHLKGEVATLLRLQEQFFVQKVPKNQENSEAVTSVDEEYLSIGAFKSINKK